MTNSELEMQHREHSEIIIKVNSEKYVLLNEIYKYKKLAEIN